MPVLFLSSRSPGVPSYPYGVTRTLNVDRDDALVNHRCKKLKQSSVQQVQNARLKPASLLSYTKSAYGDQNAKPNKHAFLRLHFPNATFCSARAMLLLKDTRPASLQPNAKLRKSACLNVGNQTRQLAT